MIALCRERETGQLTIAKLGRESVLSFQEGCLVGMRMAFGYQSLPQCLLRAGLIDLRSLDALWARTGGGEVDEEMMEVLGLNVGQCDELRTLANVQSACEAGEQAHFQPGPVEAAISSITGERVIASLEGHWVPTASNAAEVSSSSPVEPEKAIPSGGDPPLEPARAQNPSLEGELNWADMMGPLPPPEP